MTTFIFVFILLILFQLLWIISLKNDHFLKNFGIKQEYRPAIQACMLLCIICLYLILFQLAVTNSRPKPYILQTTFENTQKKLTELNQHTTETFISQRQTGDVENYYFLYLNPNKTRSVLSELTKILWQRYCNTTHCLIHLYDNKQAYEKDSERLSITDNNVMAVWNQNNYVFVAEHYLGYLGPTETNTFSYYPYKDWYYEKLKKTP